MAGISTRLPRANNATVSPEYQSMICTWLWTKMHGLMGFHSNGFHWCNAA
ncbi:hypothetical protein OH492_28050 [Vibrio chagasii]|nr:hypothetical protein [Vibrio chagasii]